ncbi:unnamed protein product, partial [Polarella glacialis]
EPAKSAVDRILYDLEHPETDYGRAPAVPRRGDLKSLQAAGEKVWTNMADKIANKPTRTNSSPSAFGMGRDSMHDDNPWWNRKPQMLQRGFGVSLRPPIYSGVDNDLGPGQYDTQLVGAMVWDRDHDVSHPGQKSMSMHSSPVVNSFGKPKPAATAAGPRISRAPGPGHYGTPNFWDPNWQSYPTKGTSFVRKPFTQSESRFGGLARRVVNGE